MSLTLKGLTVAIGTKTLVQDLDLEVPTIGLTWLVGPVSAGKSTLLRTIAGKLQDPFEVYGTRSGFTAVETALAAQRAATWLGNAREAVLAGVPNRDGLTARQSGELAEVALYECGLDAFVEDRRAFAELDLHVQRRVVLASLIVAEPRLLLLDEPTHSLDEDGRVAVLSCIRKLSFRMSVLVVTHDQRNLRDTASISSVALMSGGTIQEHSPTAEFLAGPTSEVARRFVETGGCDTPSPSAVALDIGNESPQAPWIKWVSPLLAGIPRPGLLRDTEQEFKILHRVGASTLVCLEDTPRYDLTLASAYGLKVLHFPTPDMAPASPEFLRNVSATIRERTDRGSAVIVHCKAGLGRTGMVLAAVKVNEGLAAIQAIRTIRNVEPRFIQTQAQEEALVAFERSRIP
jgi:atypical dual specificity phosphatase